MRPKALYRLVPFASGGWCAERPAAAVRSGTSTGAALTIRVAWVPARSNSSRRRSRKHIDFAAPIWHLHFSVAQRRDARACRLHMRLAGDSEPVAAHTLQGSGLEWRLILEDYVEGS